MLSSLSLQALTPAQAGFCLHIGRFVEQELGLSLAGTRLLAGFSGGADSTALLLCLHCLAPRMGFSLYAAHLDHSLRPDSVREAAFCRVFCENLGIVLLEAREDIAALSQKNKTGIEETARAARYAFYEQSAQGLRIDWIVTGHTLNDLAEDLLMRLIRGAGWPALAGMPALDARRRLLRPLLLTPRRGVENFLAGLGLTWLEDESNQDPVYFRNRVRNTLLPLILRENPAFLESAAGLWRLARIDEAFFSSQLPNGLCPPLGDKAQDEPALMLEHRLLADLPKALRLRMYKAALASLGPGQALLTNLLALDRSWLRWQEGKGKPGVHLFPGGKQAHVDKKGIAWTKT